MTYSIVARDPATGALGVAVQTCMFAVGSIVPWARAGVGAVATQAFAERSYGLRCLDLIDGGATAPEALAGAQAGDPMPALRQVGVVAADGTVAATTGEMCVDHAGHLVGDGFTAVQANMMARPEVWPAMAAAFEASTAPFPHRLLAALRAAQDAGGDPPAASCRPPWWWWMGSGPTRGPGARSTCGWTAAPIRSATWAPSSAAAAAAPPPSNEASRNVVGGDPGVRARPRSIGGWPASPARRTSCRSRAGALAAGGDFEAARAELRALVARRPGWATIVRGFAAKGLLTLPPSTTTIDDILAEPAPPWRQARFLALGGEKGEEGRNNGVRDQDRGCPPAPQRLGDP